MSGGQTFQAVLAVQQVCVLAIHHRGEARVAYPRVQLHRFQHQRQIRKRVYKRPVVLRDQGIRRGNLLEPSLGPASGEPHAQDCQSAKPAPPACVCGSGERCSPAAAAPP
jgi:hypothetical protein